MPERERLEKPNPARQLSTASAPDPDRARSERIERHEHSMQHPEAHERALLARLLLEEPAERATALETLQAWHFRHRRNGELFDAVMAADDGAPVLDLTAVWAALVARGWSRGDAQDFVRLTLAEHPDYHAQLAPVDTLRTRVVEHAQLSALHDYMRDALVAASKRDGVKAIDLYERGARMLRALVGAGAPASKPAGTVQSQLRAVARRYAA